MRGYFTIALQSKSEPGLSIFLALLPAHPIKIGSAPVGRLFKIASRTYLYSSLNSDEYSIDWLSWLSGSFYALISELKIYISLTLTSNWVNHKFWLYIKIGWNIGIAYKLYSSLKIHAHCKIFYAFPSCVSNFNFTTVCIKIVSFYHFS